MEEKRRFNYYLKLFDGRLLHAMGVDALDAMRAARVHSSQVKRHMPIKALLTAEELAARAARFEMLRQKEKEKHDEEK
jgi:hypothetical protein